MAKRTRIEREADLVVVADFYRRGWTMRNIAEQITKRRPYSVSYVTVKRDLDLLFKRWKEKQAAYIDQFKTIQLEQLQLMKKELWEQYLRSKQPTKKITEKRNGVVHSSVKPIRKDLDLVDIELEAMFEDSTAEELAERKHSLDNVEIHFTDLSETTSVEIDQTVQVEERLGDPRYIKLIAELMDQEAKLLGFYNTDKIAPSTSVVIVNMPAPVSKEDFLLDENNVQEYE